MVAYGQRSCDHASAECSRAISEWEAWTKGVALVIFATLYLLPVLPPSFLLSERPNILALRSSRKAAGLNSLRDAMVQRGWIAFKRNFQTKIKIQMPCLCSLSRVCCPHGLKVSDNGGRDAPQQASSAHTIRQSCPVTDFSDAYCLGG